MLEAILTQGNAINWRIALVSILMAFGITQAIAAVYVWTFRGLSYSRTLVQSMAMASIVTCMLMLSLGDSIAASIGIAGGLSLIRFRTTMRDPRDMVFVFASMASGISTGLQAYAVALVGTGMFIIAALLLHVTAYGSRRHFDGLLRFVVPTEADAEEALAHTLRTYCQSFVLVTLRQAAQGAFMEHAYQISIPDPSARNHLVRALQHVGGIQDVTLMMQEPTLDL